MTIGNVIAVLTDGVNEESQPIVVGVRLFDNDTREISDVSLKTAKEMYEADSNALYNIEEFTSRELNKFPKVNKETNKASAMIYTLLIEQDGDYLVADPSGKCFVTKNINGLPFTNYNTSTQDGNYYSGTISSEEIYNNQLMLGGMQGMSLSDAGILTVLEDFTGREIMIPETTVGFSPNCWNKIGFPSAIMMPSSLTTLKGNSLKNLHAETVVFPARMKLFPMAFFGSNIQRIAFQSKVIDIQSNAFTGSSIQEVYAYKHILKQIKKAAPTARFKYCAILDNAEEGEN